VTAYFGKRTMKPEDAKDREQRRNQSNAGSSSSLVHTLHLDFLLDGHVIGWPASAAAGANLYTIDAGKGAEGSCRAMPSAWFPPGKQPRGLSRLTRVPGAVLRHRLL